MTYKGWYAIKPNQPTNQPTKQTNKTKPITIDFLKNIQL